MTGARYEAGTSPICGGDAPGSASLILTLCQLSFTRESSSVVRQVAWDWGDHDEGDGLWIVVLEDPDDLILLDRDLVFSLSLVLELDPRQSEVRSHGRSRPKWGAAAASSRGGAGQGSAEG